MNAQDRGGPVHISQLADQVLALIWERIRARRAETGQPMPPQQLGEFFDDRGAA